MLKHPTVRISPRSHAVLRQLARSARRPMQAVLDRAIEAERRRRFIAEANADYARLRADPKAWADYQRELAEWDAVLMDGLDPNERWEDSTVVGQPKSRRSRSKT